jgi:YYY domain-containing protein
MEYGLVIRWLAIYLSLFVVGLPLAAALCPRLANRGSGIALPISLAIIGIVVYWIGHLSFGWVSFIIALLVLGIGSLSVFVSDRIKTDIKRRPTIETAAVFTLAFSFLIAVRAVDPAVPPAGGEKFLDYGLLRSLLRAPALPPEDFWFAGKPVKYYYGGHMLSALLAELTFTKARYAYNLALAGFYAMLVTAAYGFAGSLGERIGTARLTAGAFGAFFVGFASNLQTPLQAVLWLLPDGIARTIAGSELTGLAVSPSQFFYWNASRVIPIDPSNPESASIATEFPFFSWLNGDLHAHMMSTPFLVLVATLCFSYYHTPSDEHTRRRLLLCAIAVLGGFIAVINTWSFPTVFGLALLTLTFSPADPLSLLPARFTDRLPSPQAWSVYELRRTGGSLVLVSVLVAIGIVSSLPFWLGAVSGREITVVSERSSFISLLIIHGGFLLVFVPSLFWRAKTILDRKTLGIATLLFVPLGVIAVWIDFAALLLIGPIVLGSWVLLRVDRDRGSVGFPAVLMLAGAGLVLIVEIVYLREKAGPGRYNTVFKTYMQVWVLWGPAAGAALARIARPARPISVQSPFSLANRATFRPQGLSIHHVFQVFAILLIFSTSIYGSLALADHFNNDTYASDGPTLDSLEYVNRYHPDEAAAISWLNQLPGRPVIAAAPGLDSYGWTNPESSLTGLPTIVGWTHEIGYRNESVYKARVDDVDDLYQGPPERTVEVLRKYDVQYIYVGPREHERYGRISFERIAGVEVAERFNSGRVVIYKVNQNALAVQPSNATSRSLSLLPLSKNLSRTI